MRGERSRGCDAESDGRCKTGGGEGDGQVMAKEEVTKEEAKRTGKRTGKRAAVRMEVDCRTKATDQAHGQQEPHGQKLPRAT